MIHQLILKNFKCIKDEVFEFNKFNLIVGANNSGKKTVLQAVCNSIFSIQKKGAFLFAIFELVDSFNPVITNHLLAKSLTINH